MVMTMRWYGHNDPVTLEKIRQIPGVKGVVSAIYDIPVGMAWGYERIKKLVDDVDVKGLTLKTIESVPVHEDIKIGKPSRDEYIKNYCETLRNLGKAGIEVVCYNFMPVFDWTRSELAHELPDGSNALIYVQEKVLKMDPVNGELSLPGWDSSYTKDSMTQLLKEYETIDEEKLWENLEYFLKGIIPAAEESGIKMAIHPDDPPWSIFGLPRIIKNKSDLQRLVKCVDSEANGISLCSGSLGVDPSNNIEELVEYFGKMNRIHFAHCRNVKITSEKSFEEAAHMSEYGSLDMYKILKAYYNTGFKGPMRPDHGRMIWGETGKPGYGLYDRALGAVYLNGLWEAINKEGK